MSKQTLKFNGIKMSKKDFYTSKQPIPLRSINTKNTVLSFRVKHNDESCKYFIGYSHDVIKPLCVILPQMSRYIKYFENGGKNMAFKIEEESVYLKHSEIWNKIKSILNVKFHTEPIYDEKHIKTKVKTFNNTINALLSGYEIPPPQKKNSLCLYFNNLY